MADLRREGWIGFLAWIEMIAGTVGLLAYLWGVSQRPLMFPAWHNTIAVLFFGGNVIAGYLVYQGHSAGFKTSFFLQLIQILVLNFGTRVVFVAGLQVTAVIASTGAGVFVGPSSAFVLFPTPEGGFAASGLGYTVNLGWWLHPLREARWGLGVNVVALFFVRQLWRYFEQARATPPDARPQPTGPRWVPKAIVGVVGIIALWMAIGGPTFAGSYARQWPLATGDTIEILKYVKQYQADYVLDQKGVRVDRYLLVQFLTERQDTARDHANAVAAAALVCREADRLGFRRVLVEPTQVRGMVRYSYKYWFHIDSSGHCQGI